METLERGLLDFLRREKLGNMPSVPHDATFSSLGIDSLAAASLAVEIEKVFPAVPQNAPRIRVTLTAALSEEDIALALEVIGRHREWLAGIA